MTSAHDSGDPEITQDPGDHLADGPGRIREFLLRHAGHQAAAGQQPGRLLLFDDRYASHRRPPATAL